MAKYRLEYSGITVKLANKPFAGGGEGNLYAIIEPTKLKGFVAKIYHAHKLTEVRKKKIGYLAQFPPYSTEENSDEHPSVIWVKDALYDGDKFVGFIMPYTNGEKLEILCMPKIPRKLRPQWKRFDFKASANALDMRLKLCFNICAAIHQVHSMHRYILVDMKPDNIIIQPNGLVSIVDTDSVEVVENGVSLFDAPVATPEYTPPEFYQDLDYDPTETETWDRFGLGVILYKLLFGIHPFAASSEHPYENLVTLHDKIKAGLFVHHPAKQNNFKIIPPPHKEFYKIDKKIQDLFLACFVDGHSNPDNRPTAEEWCANILLALDDEAAYKRYGHILGKGLLTSRPRFALPSSTIPFPKYPESTFKLVELSKTNVTIKPRVSQIDITQLKEFDESAKLDTGSIAMGLFALIIIATIITPFMAMVAAGYLLRKAYTNFTSQNIQVRKQAITNELSELKSKYRKKSKTVKSLQKKFKRSIRRIVPKVEKITKTLKTEIDQLKTFLQQQDERVKEIEKKAIAQYKNLNNKYVQKALSNRIIARIEHKEYDSLTKIQWELNKSHKIAVNLLTQKTPISEQHPKFKEGKIEIDSLVKEKKLKINTKTSASITKLKEQQQKEINEIIEQNSKDNHLLQNLKRLFKGSRWRDNEETLLSTKSYLKLLDFYSISQIKKIDSRNGFIHLLSGVHNKISIKDFKDHKIVMKNLLQWFDESKHQKEFKLKKIAEIKQRYRLKTKELDDQKRISLKGLSREKKEQLEKVKIEVQKVVLGAPFTKLQEQHETVTEYIDELQTDYVEEENLILQDYNILHEQIIKESKAKVSLTEQNIKALENKLQVYNNKISHPKIQANYKLFETELGQLKNVVKNLEIKESEYQKYQNISYFSFLDHIIKQK